MKIGVFDSGIGGRSIADKLAGDFPEAEVIYVHDREHMPYGLRSHDEIISLTEAAIKPLLAGGCDVIVIACNTATAAAIDTLRVKHPETPFIGIEPMVKPAAALTKTGTIAVCATPYTLKSERYANLKRQYTEGLKVIEPDCSNWANMIEESAMQEAEIKQTVDDLCSAGADVIVLACTHYHWIKEDVMKYAEGRADVIDPSVAISARVKEILGGE